MKRSARPRRNLQAILRAALERHPDLGAMLGTDNPLSLRPPSVDETLLTNSASATRVHPRNRGGGQ